MKEGHFYDLLTAVDAFKNNAGATVTDVRKCLMSLGRRLAPKTITDGLKRAARLGFVVSVKRRYYPGRQLAQSRIVQFRRGRRSKKVNRGKPKCPCFSKASRYRTATKRSYSRRNRLKGYDSLEARRKRRRPRRRRTRRRMFNLDSLRQEDSIIRARRRRRRSTRRRRGRRRDNEDSGQKLKRTLGNNKQINLVRSMNVEVDVDSVPANDQREKGSEETVEPNEKVKENIIQNENQDEQQDEDIKTENSEDRQQTGEGKSEHESETHSKSEDESETDKGNKEDKDRFQNESEDEENANKTGEDSACTSTSDPNYDMETDDYDNDMYS